MINVDSVQAESPRVGAVVFRRHMLRVEGPVMVAVLVGVAKCDRRFRREARVIETKMERTIVPISCEKICLQLRQTCLYNFQAFFPRGSCKTYKKSLFTGNWDYSYACSLYVAW